MDSQGIPTRPLSVSETGVRVGRVREDWANRFGTQAQQCGVLGSELYRRLLSMLGEDVRRGGSTWDLIEAYADLRYGEAGPLRLVGAAHRLALSGRADHWADVLPSCGGHVPDSDEGLLAAWSSLVDSHGDDLCAGMAEQVQTNEVSRSAALALGLAAAGFDEAHLIELGCSGGLNLRLDHYSIRVGDLTLGRDDSMLRLLPELRGRGDVAVGEALGVCLPEILSRTGIDPYPLEPATRLGGVRLMSFIWPDQLSRIDRTRAAIEISGKVPAELIASDDSAVTLGDVLSRGGPRVVQHSIVWQYIAPAMRWAITDVIESAGERASRHSPLAWIRYEPDEWNRGRAAVWVRTWPHGQDRLVAHADFHGRWLAPI